MAVNAQTAPQRRTGELVLSLGALILIAWIDYVTGPELMFTIFFLGPIAFLAWRQDRRIAYFAAILAAVMWYLLDAKLRVYLHPIYAVLNALSRLVIYVGIVMAVATLRRYGENLEELAASRAELLIRGLRDRQEAQKQLLEIRTATQKQIAQELHDSVGQMLTVVALRAKRMALDLEASGSPLAQEASALVKQVNDVAKKAQELSHGLEPLESEHNELPQSLHELAWQVSDSTSIKCNFLDRSQELELSKTQKSTLFRIAQEAVNNAVKHSGSAVISITLGGSGTTPVLEVQDAGTGFARGRSEGGIGLRTMHDRAKIISAALEITSGPGVGTMVRCAVPGKT
jgi:signal transduction histidine kinase